MEAAALYLAQADAALPGRIEGLYLVGSVALGDYQAGRSDVDFIAVTTDKLARRELDQMRAIHRKLSRNFSGIYVTWNELRRNPSNAVAPFHLEGTFGYQGGFEANPSVWATLKQCPVALRGPANPNVWLDDAELRLWNLANLNGYWKNWAQRHNRLTGRGLGLLSDQLVCWCVPGVLRPLYTIATGRITSKSGACEYALARFPSQWHGLLRETLRLRRGEGPGQMNRLSRRGQALAFMEFAIDDANRGARS